jgi:hypothetical protein
MAKNNSSTTENSYLKFINRAPYELARLLQHLPADFSSCSPASEDAIKMAEAAAQHAENALSTVHHGIEAMGEALFVAFENDDYDISPHNLRGIASLIQHLGVEAQLLSETKDEMEYIVGEQKTRYSKQPK